MAVPGSRSSQYALFPRARLPTCSAKSDTTKSMTQVMKMKIEMKMKIDHQDDDFFDDEQGQRENNGSVSNNKSRGSGAFSNVELILKIQR